MPSRKTEETLAVPLLPSSAADIFHKYLTKNHKCQMQKLREWLGNLVKNFREGKFNSKN